LTNSCTAALEMAAILLEIKAGGEVIIPAYGYVSTANAFALRGAKIVFAEPMKDSPNIDVALLPSLITKKTKAIVVMHYGGIAVDMDVVMELADVHGIFVVEDAAHGIDAYYRDRPLGTIGHLGALSFHSTKNITSGHGGLLMVNDPQFVERSNVIWQKGTDKTKFDLGIQKYYEWTDLGSSFYPSEMIAAYLFAQLQHAKEVTRKRLELWEYYFTKLVGCDNIVLPTIPNYAKHNGHIFYTNFENEEGRARVVRRLEKNSIAAYSHYMNLAKSPYLAEQQELPTASLWESTLLRLPMYYDLSNDQIDLIVDVIYKG